MPAVLARTYNSTQPFELLNSGSPGVSIDSDILSVTEKKLYVHYYLPVTQNDEELRFNKLTRNWLVETIFMSSQSDIASNPNYQLIIDMGENALPFIFRHLQREPNHWFEALTAITNVNPIRDIDRGDIKAMTEQWLNWGKAKGYI